MPVPKGPSTGRSTPTTSSERLLSSPLYLPTCGPVCDQRCGVLLHLCGSWQRSSARQEAVAAGSVNPTTKLAFS